MFRSRDEAAAKALISLPFRSNRLPDLSACSKIWVEFFRSFFFLLLCDERLCDRYMHDFGVRVLFRVKWAGIFGRWFFYACAIDSIHRNRESNDLDNGHQVVLTSWFGVAFIFKDYIYSLSWSAETRKFYCLSVCPSTQPSGQKVILSETFI